jgi:hypothetical protein
MPPRTFAKSISTSAEGLGKIRMTRAVPLPSWQQAP